MDVVEFVALVVLGALWVVGIATVWFSLLGGL